jgi:hypothetical protein
MVAAMSPEITSLSIVHRPAATQAEFSTTSRAISLRWRGVVGDNLFAVNSLGDFHDCSSLFLFPGRLAFQRSPVLSDLFQ